jgi:MFS transporter, DHA2 family, multidrug resistance protein
VDEGTITRHKWLASALVTCGVFLAMVNTTVVNVVLTKMLPTLGTDMNGIQWVIIAYFLGGAVAMTFVGWLGDRIGHRNMYVTGLLVFSLMAGVCGMAQSLSFMIAARFVQGLGEGMLLTVGLLLLNEIFPAEQRGLAMGFYALGGAFGPAVGPTLGGLLTEYGSWTWVFTMNLPIGVAVALLTWLLVDNRRVATSSRLDVIGVVLLSSSLMSFVTLTAQGQQEGWWASDYILTLGLIFAVSTIAFVLWQAFAREPLFPRSLFHGRRDFWLGLGVVAATSITMFAGMFVVPTYIERLRGYTPLQTGLIMLPGSLTAAFLTVAVGALSDKWRPKWIGFVCLVGAVPATWVFRTSLDSPRSAIVGDFFVFITFSIAAMIPMILLTLATLNEKEASHGTALVNIDRLVAGSFGTAWATSLISNKQAEFFVGLTSRVDPGSQGAKQLMDTLGASSGGAWYNPDTVAQALAMGKGLIEASAASFAFAAAMKYLALASLVGLVLLLFARNVRSQGGAAH